jgi:hypothetical protein
MTNIRNLAFPLALLVISSVPAYADLGSSFANSPQRFVFPLFWITVVSLGFGLIRPILALTAYPLFAGVIGYIVINDDLATLRRFAAETYATDNLTNWMMLVVAIAIPLISYAVISSFERLGDRIKQHLARRRAARSP